MVLRAENWVSIASVPDLCILLTCDKQAARSILKCLAFLYICFKFISCVHVTEATETAVKPFDGEIMDLIYYYYYYLFFLKLYVPVNNVSAILGRLPGFNQ